MKIFQRLCYGMVMLASLSLPVNNGRSAESSQTEGKWRITADGMVHIPSHDVPLSIYMSEEAKKRFIEEASGPQPGDGEITGSISKRREVVDGWIRPRVELARKLWPVDIEDKEIGSTRVHIVTPKLGIPAAHRDSVLINLHGGAFSVGAIWGGLAASIPISGVGEFKVVSVDYRMAPESRFPAASEDVTSVYKYLLKRYRPRNIGIYGCSAGGILTGEVVAWLQKEMLPLPGAVGIFCAADGILGGDSRYISSSLDVSFGLPGSPPPGEPNPPSMPLEYFSGSNLFDPLVSPGTSMEVLARFPPTLLISGTRDAFMSSVIHLHSELTKAGVDASLHLWDGMGHGFLAEMDLPESKEAYRVIANFFDKHIVDR